MPMQHLFPSFHGSDQEPGSALGLVWLVGTGALFYFPGFGRSTFDATFITTPRALSLD
jgi:hypothetical protein